MENGVRGVSVHPVVDGVHAVSAALDATADADAWALNDDDLVSVVEECERLSARVAELGLRLVRELDARDFARREGAPSTTAWLRHRLRLRPRDARNLVTLANRLREQPPPMDWNANVGSAVGGWTMPATAAALAEGAVSVEHATVVSATMAEMPSSLSPQQLRAAEEHLAGWAREYNPTEVSTLGRALIGLLDTDTLEEKEQRAYERRELRLTDRGDGSTRIAGQLDNESAELLRAALDPLAKPAPAAAGEPDRRSGGQRYADALTELARRALNIGDLPSGHEVRPHLSVIIRLETLQAMTGQPGVPVGELGGSAISAEAARRVGCDADVSAVVVNADGQPLNAGRAQRTVNPAQWAALRARDGGCAFPGCMRPPEWCDAHHIVWWAHGGATDVNNLVLLCGYHHRQVHHHGWDVEIAADGYPQFLPPQWIDPARKPRRNDRPRPHTVFGPGP